ncbi:MAG TPA: ABC-type transport auxiliary lipoprotein family protein [Candidatus Binataceae bacterium]|nr:ABC-type transport auxiliary lipoprotein family protein [Candidatus Binataceae bacterium]
MRERAATPIALTLAASFAGCSLLARSVPATHRYQLAPTTAVAEIPPTARIELRNVTGSEPFQDTGIAYQTSPYRLDTYKFHRWVEPPTDLVSERLHEIIYSPSPVGPETAAAHPLLLDTRIKAFQEVDDGAQHTGVVAIRFCIFPRDPFSRALWCKVISKESPAGGDTPEQAAEAISMSFNQVMAEFASELTAEIRQVASDGAAKESRPSAGSQ